MSEEKMTTKTLTQQARGAAWLAEARQKAWDIFLKTEPPAKTVETWRRVNFGAWRLGLLTEANLSVLFGPEKSHDAPIPSLEEEAGLFLQDGNRLPGVFAAPPELAKQGVLFMSLEEAAARHPQLVEPHLKGLTGSPDFRMLESANLAQFHGGVFLYIPQGVKLEKPIDITFSHYPTSPFCFPRVLVIVEKGAEATIVEGYHFDERKASNDARKLSSIAFSRLIVGESAKVRYFYNQELSLDTAHFWHQQVDLAARARLQHCSTILGSAVHKSELDVHLNGAGARSEIYGIAFGSKDQLFDPHTAQWHQTDHTQSDLLFRVALKGKARSIYTGLIRIDKGAIGSEAYQQNNNLLLSNEARADTTPILEILTDEVHCKHGATMGPVNPEELFYLCSRGLDPKEAEKILILGFLDPIVSKLPLARLRERIPEKIEKRLMA